MPAMQETIIYHPIKVEQIEQALILAEGHHSDVPALKDYPFDKDMAREAMLSVAGFANHPSGWIGIASTETGLIIGILCAFMSGCHFSRVTIARDVMFWVAPKYRGKGVKPSPVFRELVDRYEIWARLSPDLAKIMLSFDTGHRRDKAYGYILGRLGYEHNSGEQYCKNA